MNLEYLHHQEEEQWWERSETWRASHPQNTQKSPFEDKQQTPPWILHIQEYQSSQSPHHALNAYQGEPEHWCCSSPPRTSPTHTSSPPYPPPGTDPADVWDPPWKKPCRLKRERNKRRNYSLPNAHNQLPYRWREEKAPKTLIIRNREREGRYRKIRRFLQVYLSFLVSLHLCDVKETTVKAGGGGRSQRNYLLREFQLLSPPLFLYSSWIMMIPYLFILKKN